MNDEQRKPDITGRLLEGRTGFSRDEQGELFESVFAEVSAQEAAEAPVTTRPWWMMVLGWAAVLALVATPVVLFVTSSQEPEFGARGGDGANLELRCADPCTQGAVLTLELTGAKDATRGRAARAPQMRYLAAFARNEQGNVVWYLPKTDLDSSLEIEAGSASHTVEVGPEHEPGKWTVHAILSDRALRRADVRQLFDDEGELRDSSVELMTRELVVK